MFMGSYSPSLFQISSKIFKCFAETKVGSWLAVWKFILWGVILQVYFRLAQKSLSVLLERKLGAG